YGRGPEYRLIAQKIKVTAGAGGKHPDQQVSFQLQRGGEPMGFGGDSGGHHNPAGGRAPFTDPHQGGRPPGLVPTGKGEGLNVGCCLTWGPCYDYQRKFFEATPHKLTEPFTVLKYDVEVSGFGSQALGHVCLLNLRDQTYPGSDGTKLKGWPTWTTPLMRWGKEQGAVTGYAPSANGLGLNPDAASARLFKALDADGDGAVTKEEATAGRWPLPEPFATIDANADGKLSPQEML